MNTSLLTNVKNEFVSKFQRDPVMVFSPGRINIIGEHTDYNDGFVFPAAVDKGIIAAINKSDSDSCTAYATDKEETFMFSLKNIGPLSQGSWQNYLLGVVAEIQKIGKSVGNFNIVFGGNIPVGSGMSSSAALENSVVLGLNEVFKLGLSKHEMILISQQAEHNHVGVKCGIMDQYASMFGIENKALLLDCRTITSDSFEIDFQHHEFALINTNVKHSLSDSAYNDRRSVCESVAKMLNIPALRDATELELASIKDKISPENYQKVRYVIQENERAISASKAMQQGDLEALGKLLYASHEGLQNQYKVSCDELDFLVGQAKLNEHVLGARMMGGGFGGCTINLVAKDGAENFKAQASKAYKAQFNRACSIYDVKLSQGTHLIN